MQKFNQLVISLLPSSFVLLGYQLSDPLFFNISIGLSWLSVILYMPLFLLLLILNFSIQEDEFISKHFLREDKFLKGLDKILCNKSYYMFLRLLQLPLFFWFYYMGHYVLGSFEIFCIMSGMYVQTVMVPSWKYRIKRVKNDKS